jgi:hypothetical protein
MDAQHAIDTEPLCATCGREHTSNIAPVVWGVVVGGLQVASPLVLWSRRRGFFGLLVPALAACKQGFTMPPSIGCCEV